MSDLFSQIPMVPVAIAPYKEQRANKNSVNVPSQWVDNNYPTLRKGQKVTLRSGRLVTVEGESQAFFWVVRESLPYWKDEIVG